MLYINDSCMCLPRLFYTRVALYIFRYSQFSRLSFKSIKWSAADGDGRLVAFETAPRADNDEDRGQVQEFISAPHAEVKTRKPDGQRRNGLWTAV